MSGEVSYVHSDPRSLGRMKKRWAGTCMRTVWWSWRFLCSCTFLTVPTAAFSRKTVHSLIQKVGVRIRCVNCVHACFCTAFLHVELSARETPPHDTPHLNMQTDADLTEQNILGMLSSGKDEWFCVWSRGCQSSAHCRSTEKVKWSDRNVAVKDSCPSPLIQ